MVQNGSFYNSIRVKENIIYSNKNYEALDQVVGKLGPGAQFT